MNEHVYCVAVAVKVTEQGPMDKDNGWGWLNVGGGWWVGRVKGGNWDNCNLTTIKK